MLAALQKSSIRAVCVISSTAVFLRFGRVPRMRSFPLESRLSPASILMPVVDNFHANTYAELGS